LEPDGRLAVELIAGSMTVSAGLVAAMVFSSKPGYGGSGQVRLRVLPLKRPVRRSAQQVDDLGRRMRPHQTQLPRTLKYVEGRVGLVIG
jgi:hypothetical protein